MSSKEKGKHSATNVSRNASENRDVSGKKVSKNPDDKEKSKASGDKSTTKEDKLIVKRSGKIDSEKAPDNNAQTLSHMRKIKDESYEYGTDERRKKNERENLNRDDAEKLLKENKKKHRSDPEDSTNKHRYDKEESKRKHGVEKDDFNSKNRNVNDEHSRHRTNKDDDSKGRHMTDKDESNSRHRTDQVESRSRHKLDKEEDYKRRHRTEKDDSIDKHRADKEESKSRHKTEKLEPDSRQRTEKVKDDEQRRTSSHKDRNITDGRGDKTVPINTKSSSDKKVNQHSVKLYEEPIKNRTGFVEYEEDFEDYNDDEFEDAESSGSVLSEKKEMNEESSQSSSQKEIQKPVLREKDEAPKVTVKNKDGIHSSFINFRLAQKKCSNDAVANKMLSRAYDLSRLIDLDRSHFDILDMPPVLEHSKYMLMFGRAGCLQVGSQTGDDNMGRECQTEVIDERTVWCQNPPLDEEGCVRVVLDTSRSHLDSFLTNDMTKTALEMLNESGLSSAPLVQILELMDRVLEEEAAPEVATKILSNVNGQQMMSLGYNKYSCDNLPCLRAVFSMQNSAIFATVHQRNSDSDDSHDNVSDSFVSIWRVSSNYREPQRCLTCPNHNEAKSCITSLIFSPDPCPSLLFGGLDSGIIALWDLKDHGPTPSVGDPPAYFTGVRSEVSGQTHQNPVIALHTSTTKTTSSSYQLLSLDSAGILSVWIVSSLLQTGPWTVASGSLADLNLRPGSRVRMSIIGSVSLVSAPANSAPAITCMTVDPANPSHIFVGNQNGQIIHHDRTVQKPVQGHSHCRGRVYGPKSSFEVASVTHLDFYPFYEPYILAGYSDGVLKVFTMGRAECLISLSWRARSAILVCKWSRSHPAVIFSLDGDGNMTIWNVLTSVYVPAVTQKLPGYIGFDLSSDSRWHSSDHDRAVTNKARLLVWALDGRVEVHELQDAFVVPQLDDCFKTCSFFQSLL